MIDLYWKNIKKKFEGKYHFNTKSKKKDYQYIGNIVTDFSKIDRFITKIPKIYNVTHAIEKAPKLANKEVLERIKAFKHWGYTKFNTEFYQVFSNDHKKIFEKFIKLTGLEQANASIILQYPGHTIPWHYDTHINFYKKAKELKIKKKPIRYMIFLKDWDWGHNFSIGASIVNKWKKGDIITWNPIMFHAGSNSGISPKVTMNITGLIGKKSIHLKKKIKFIKLS